MDISFVFQSLNLIFIPQQYAYVQSDNLVVLILPNSKLMVDKRGWAPQPQRLRKSSRSSALNKILLVPECNLMIDLTTYHIIAPASFMSLTYFVLRRICSTLEWKFIVRFLLMEFLNPATYSSYETHCLSL